MSTRAEPTASLRRELQERVAALGRAHESSGRTARNRAAASTDSLHGPARDLRPIRRWTMAASSSTATTSGSTIAAPRRSRLLVHELATNAMKYSSLERRRARAIETRVTRTLDCDGRRASDRACRAAARQRFGTSWRAEHRSSSLAGSIARNGARRPDRRRSPSVEHRLVPRSADQAQLRRRPDARVPLRRPSA